MEGLLYRTSTTDNAVVPQEHHLWGQDLYIIHDNNILYNFYPFHLYSTFAQLIVFGKTLKYQSILCTIWEGGWNGFCLLVQFQFVRSRIRKHFATYGYIYGTYGWRLIGLEPRSARWTNPQSVNQLLPSLSETGKHLFFQDYQHKKDETYSTL